MSGTGLIAAVPTPDFVTYSADPSIADATLHDRWVEVGWTNGDTARFHNIWLADNAADTGAIDPHSHEKLIDIADLQADMRPLDVSVSAQGALIVIWDVNRSTHYHQGWLRAHRYDPAPQNDSEPRRLWDASSQIDLPIFDWSDVEHDPDTRLQFLTTVRSFGLVILVDGPTTLPDFQRRIQQILIVRNMNWGMFFDVLYEPDGKYISNKGVDIAPHTDGPTREHMPGVMCFHCLDNTVAGGDSFWVDGFHIADQLEADDPEAYRLLSTIPWRTADRSPDSAYAHDAPLICLDHAGRPSEIRDTHWLREPLVTDFELVEPMYRAYRAWSERTRDPASQIHHRLEPRQTAIIDNRRVLHARGPYDETPGGHRHMHACYSEREELDSAIRIITRTRAGPNGST